MRLGVSAAVVGDVIVDGDVEIVDGRINAVGIPGSGSGLAVPGFVDLHTHGYGGIDFAFASPDQISEAATRLTATGVTAFQPTLMTLDMAELVQGIESHSNAVSDGARILGTHVEGPFLAPEYPGAHRPDLLAEPDFEIVEQLLAAGHLAQMTLAPELHGAVPVIRALVDNSVVVSLGHSNATVAEANLGFDAGATALTHIFNASRPMSHRDPGIIGAALTRSDVFITAVVDGVHLEPEATLIAARMSGSRFVAVTDAMAAAGLGDGVYTLGNQQVTVDGGEARLADGTIASSVLTMNQALRNLVDLGMPTIEAVRAVSTAPAMMAQRPDLGRLDAGSIADVVVLDDAFDVSATFVAGEKVFAA